MNLIEVKFILVGSKLFCFYDLWNNVSVYIFAVTLSTELGKLCHGSMQIHAWKLHKFLALNRMVPCKELQVPLDPGRHLIQKP